MTKTEWEDWKDDNSEDFWALKDLAEENGNYDLFGDAVPNDEVDNLVRDNLDNYGWSSVFNLLEDIADDRNAEFYELDGYGNLRQAESWDYYADELEKSLDFDEEDEDEDEEEDEEEDEDDCEEDEEDDEE